MKLSEAIRMGGLLDTQCQGAGAHKPGKGTCALEGAAKALGLKWMTGMTPYDELMKVYPWVTEIQKYRNNWQNEYSFLCHIANVLNDKLQWNREQIAIFVEGFESKLDTVKEEEVTSHVSL